MRINLQDIGEEGHEFKLKWREEKAVDEKVRLAVESIKNFQFRIFIQKTGDIYTAMGDYAIDYDQECSLCAEDITLPLKGRFTEYLMNQTKADQKGHAPHNGLNIDSQHEVTFVQHHELELGEFIAELFTLAVTPYPKCIDTKACEERQEENRRYVEAQSLKGHPAFSVLSKLKKK